ncbi:hypothetical protein C343_04483 [Cryptococcus neoformans C23]|uniref:Uncharacterized protein n=2 Tax=Cryptococcus neoformans TaxID=5207 RepID=A0A854QB08_CRYNE|nr:hypothetical protein CNAG_07713 [Cryptococcus neoformans var. grubii H99]AUB26270.1 hypothetical protein CKF44_07713 [Cryptococcus neoformans var. grubii]OWZ30248.1 hypothetical protein C347_04530 [Cryptococcus neoformans var. grubii AD2-60a]OWZ38211.1 hypothetical protein C353_04383 [Cryptococcus neoformans var. grubii AD1-83a]OWZ41967.1 hypothetical protein C343_04483 [Cryptococcus neoformans var. grubii C23]OWZ52991.1 hypothetical protein C368_04556 [Cryptococcus neoformans var. grubii 1|eukprot:XP_012051367.1 hypothetical protein CNAG_07713 [Cryptococcus neoformans var. grubii H99]
MRGGGEEAMKVVGRLPVIVVGEWHAAIMEWYASIARYCEPSHGVIIMCRRCAPSCNSHRGTTLLEQEVEEERENDGAPAIE